MLNEKHQIWYVSKERRMEKASVIHRKNIRNMATDQET